MEAYTVAIPWYEPEDFSELLRLAQDREEMPADYQTWHRNALGVLEAWLAKGRAIEIVTVRPREYLAWIKARDMPNTATSRRRYVESLAGYCQDAA